VFLEGLAMDAFDISAISSNSFFAEISLSYMMTSVSEGP